MQAPERARSGPLSRPVLSIAVLLAFAVLVGLGVWQVRRLQWKQQLLADVAAAERSPARPLAGVLAGPGEPTEFVRVSVVCPGLNQAPFLELHAILDGVVGSRLISACRAPAGRYGGVLVDRGFVAETISSRPPVETDATAPVSVVGVLRSVKSGFAAAQDDPARNRWFRRDVPKMAAALGLKTPAPLFLIAETSTNPEWAALRPAPLPGEISNNHLGYAVTWFGLAAALLGVYAAMLRRPKAPA